MSMPDEIELPSATDFCRGVYRNPKNQCCFIGWQRMLFPEMDTQECRQFGRTAVKEGNKMGIQSLPGEFNITHANDDKLNSKVKLAKWFENTIKALGYDVS